MQRLPRPGGGGTGADAATRLYLGVDLGGTQVKLGLCTAAGEVRARRAIPTEAARGPDDTLARISAAAHALMESAGRAVACGVGVPGPLDPGRELLVSALNLPAWTSIPLPELLGRRLEIPTVLENDANCAAWAEYRTGIGRGSRSLVMYTLGTGVGGGIILDGHVWLGLNGAAGRLGHVSLDPNGPLCACGQRGCLEQYASGTAIARRYGRGTARETFEAAARGDPSALEVVDFACDALAASIAGVIQIMHPETIVLGGGVAAAGDPLLERVRAGLRRRVYAHWLERIRLELSALGADAGWIGAALWAERSGQQFHPSPPSHAQLKLNRDFAGLLTEQRNPRTMDLDRKPLLEILRIMNQEDATVADAVGKELHQIARAVELIVDRLRRGGQVYFVGAGTSGRLGVMEAAEQTPTLETPDSVYQSIIAGGPECVFRSSEGAEDVAEDGAQQIRLRQVRPQDVVVGIAASGTTPFVHGALLEARERKAGRVLIVCNLEGVPADAADVTIAPVVGPEVLTGATRLRAATACKMVLNMTTVASMVLTGKVYENLSVDVPKRSDKLVARAVRIVRTLTSASEEDALRALEAADFRAKIAVVMVQKNVSREEADRILDRSNGFLRDALED